MKDDRRKNSALTLAIYKRCVNRYRALFFLGAGGAALAVISQGLIPPYIVARIFSKLQFDYAHHHALLLGGYMHYFLAYALSMLAGIIFWRGQSYAIWRLEENVQRDIANDVYDHLQSQSESFHANHFGGALVSQTNKFITAYVRLMD